jgi:uncharacterized membrane protein YbhN (UPF0104 family)
MSTPDTSQGLGRALRSRSKQIALGLVMGGLALGLALWGVPLAEVGEALAQAELLWLLPPALMFLVQQALRAWRQALIVQARHPDHSFRTSLSVLCISFLFINTLPARLGEVVRPLLLLERDGIPMGTGFAAVFLERAIDLCAMLVMIALVAWMVPVPSHTLVVQGTEIDWVRLGRVAAGTAMPVLLGGLLVVVLGGRPLLRRLRAVESRLPASLSRVSGLVLGFGESFVDGLDAVRQPWRLAGILGLTTATWALTGLMYPALARAFGIEGFIGFGEGVGVLSITMLGMAVPAAPGFAGTYEAFVRGGLALFGVAGGDGGVNLDAIAVAFALTMHWWIFVVQASTAVFFLAVDRIDVRRLLGAVSRTLSAPGGAQPSDAS